MDDIETPRVESATHGASRTLIYRVAELRALEAATAARLAPGDLMRRAGHAAAHWALRLAGEKSGPIVVLIGPGNNGGDALVTATALQRQGMTVRVCFLEKPETLRGDAATALANWDALGVQCAAIDDRGLVQLAESSMVIDGLFGLGLSRTLSARAKLWIDQVNRWQQQSRLPLLALDIPSGLDADTGCVQEVAIKATHTMSFLGACVGLYTGDGPGLVGHLTLESLGVDPTEKASGILVEPSLFRAYLKPRPGNSHKGTFGSLGVLAGTRGMRGAALLASRTALLAGAGRVYVSAPGEAAPELDFLQPELMWRQSLEDARLTAAVAGPGLGDEPQAYAALEALLRRGLPTVIDADALNAISRDPPLRALARNVGAQLVATPHPLEAARLLGTDARAIQANRIDAALNLADALHATVVLKGCGSVVARPDGAWAINPTGNPGLATGGTGDVLAGFIGSLLAQGWSTWAAALGGTWMHGAAADALVARGVGPIGLTASELIPAIRDEQNRLVRVYS